MGSLRALAAAAVLGAMLLLPAMAGTSQAALTATPWGPVAANPFSALSAVSNTSVALSTTAAGATGVSYTVEFKTSSTGQLVFPDTVTLTAPAGTFTNASFQIFDVTQNNRSIGGSEISNDGATAVLRISTGTPTGAGDVLRVVITDATNSTAGQHNIQISTSSDTTPVNTPPYTLVAAQPLSNASVVPSTTAAGATGVSYTVEFKTSSTGQLTFPGTVTLTGPAGTFTNASFQIFDVTQNNRSIGGSEISNDGATAVLRITTGTPTGAGDVLRVVITDATNAAAGQHNFQIDTSSDTPVTTPNYTLVNAQPLSNASVVPSTTAAGATGVSYTVEFKTSSTGQLTFPGTVTLTGPAGTFTNASFQIFDVTQNNRSIGGSEISNDGATAVLRITTGTPTGAGDVLRVVITDATNAAAGPRNFQIDTSSDTPVTTPNYTLVNAQPLSNASVVPSTTAAGATGVSYTVEFKTSSTGQLTFPGTVTLTGPAGTFTNASFQIFDVTQNNRSIGGSEISNDGATAVLRITTGTPTGAGDVLRVVITDATNAAAGPRNFQIDTSSDTPVTTPNYTLVNAQPLSNASVVPSTTAAGATGVSYTVEFKTSSTGQLTFPGTVTLTGPAGTFTNASFQIFDVTQNNRSIGGSEISNDGATAVLRITTGTPTGAGDVLRVVITDATNAAAGPRNFQIDTSSDTPVTTPNYTLVNAQPLSNASVVPSTTAAGATGVSYTVEFKTSSTGQLTFPGTVTLTGPAGTFTNASFQIFDVTQNNRSIGGSEISNDGATAVLRITTGTPTGAGDVLRVVITDATNAAAGQHNIQIDTSSDTPVSSPYTLGSGPPPPPPPPPDTTPPDTTVTAGPAGSTEDDTPTFEFNANEGGSSFECSIDGGAFVPCSSPFTTPSLAAGQHTFSVRARDAAGNVGPTSTATFQVEPKQLEDLPPLTNDDVGEVAQVAPASGTVLIAVQTARAARAGASQKGLTFVPLEEAREVPVGSFLDTSRGTVEMVSATGQGNRTQSGKFSQGVFQVLQSRKRRDRGLTQLNLKGGNFKRCGSARGRKASAAGLSRRTVRRLRANARGRFRTGGRNSSATVRGTVWTTTDRCDGTLTQVRRGSVVVRDFRRKRNVVVRAGKSYLARAPR